MSDLRALDRCPVCGTPGSLVSSDEGTSYFRPAVPATDEPKPCARYWGSDGTLCSTHNGRFVDDGTTGGVMKCDRALAASATEERNHPPSKAQRESWMNAGQFARPAVPALAQARLGICPVCQNRFRDDGHSFDCPLRPAVSATDEGDDR